MPKDKDGQVISYIEDGAWGITKRGHGIYLGSKASIMELLSNPRKKATDERVQEIITLERSLTTKEGLKEARAQSKITAEKVERHQRAVELGLAKEPRRRNKSLVKVIKRKVQKTSKPRKTKNRA